MKRRIKTGGRKQVVRKIIRESSTGKYYIVEQSDRGRQLFLRAWGPDGRDLGFEDMTDEFEEVLSDPSVKLRDVLEMEPTDKLVKYRDHVIQFDPVGNTVNAIVTRKSDVDFDSILATFETEKAAGKIH